MKRRESLWLVARGSFAWAYVEEFPLEDVVDFINVQVINFTKLNRW
jgi:hypothetical protein